MDDLSRLCIHTITTKPWDIDTAVREYAQAGVSGVTVWRNVFESHSPGRVRKLVGDAGLVTVSLCRGGFFPHHDPAKRRAALDDNRTAIEEAHELGAPFIVLVCGADPEQPLSDSRAQIADGIRELLPELDSSGVGLAVEPLHPMYADTRSAITTLGEATDLAIAMDHPGVGVAIDVYHVWWDPHLPEEIGRCGTAGKISAFHVCDWRVPTRSFLTDRGLMGEGCIPIPDIRRSVEAAGFAGPCEVEIFSDEYWAMDQHEYLNRIVSAFREAV